MALLQTDQPLILLFTRPRSEIEPKLNSFLQNQTQSASLNETNVTRTLRHFFIENPLKATVFHSVLFDLEAETILTGLKIGYEYETREGHEQDLMDIAGFSEGISFGSLFGAVAVLWEPAKVVTGFAHFQSAVFRFSLGGIFPVTCTVYFAACVENELITEGLSWFCGQEIEFDHTGLTQKEALNRILQIANQLIVFGPIRQAKSMHDIGVGNSISIVPSEHSTILYLSMK